MRRPLALFSLTASLFATTASAADEKLICVYDPMGTSGPAYQNAQKMAIEAAAQGVTIKLRADVEEKTAAEDLVAGKCDGAVVTGVEARKFGLISATVEAIGALPRYDWLKTTLAYLKDPRLAPKMKAGAYETGGIFPGGAVLLFTHNKAWTNSKDLAGKSLAIIGDDAAALTMAREVGASTKTATTATFGTMFNSNSVDGIYGPAAAYEPLELYRGLGNTGGIIDFPLSQLTLQLVMRTDSFPEGFGQWGREYAYTQFDRAINLVKQAETKIAKHLVQIPEADKPGYDEKFLKVRLALRDKGVYSSLVLGLMHKVRCKSDPARAECADPQE